MSFNDFVHEYKLKIKATSKIKIQQILSSLSLSDVKIHLWDGPFSNDVGIGSLHVTRGTHWVA